MSKRLLMILIVAAVVLTGLYQVRIQLLTTAFNTALKKLDIRLLQLEGVDLGWDGVEINRLVLGLGKIEDRQILQGVHLSYSVLDIQPQLLTIKRAVLTYPQFGGSETDTGTDDAPLLLTELVQQLMSVPLHSIIIDVLEVDGFSSPVINMPVRLRAAWEGSDFSFSVAEAGRELLLQLTHLSSSEQILTVKLASALNTVFYLKATVLGGPQGHQISGRGRLSVSSALPMLAPAMSFPDVIKTVSGELEFQLAGQILDDVRKIAQQQWKIEILPQSALALELANSGTDVSLLLDFPQPLNLSMQAGELQDLSLTLSGDAVNWQLENNAYAVNANGRLSAIQCSYGNTLRCLAELDVEMAAAQIKLPDEPALVAENIELKLSSQIAVDGDNLSATLAAGEWFRAASVQQSDVLLTEPALVADSSGHVSYQVSSGELSVKVDQLQLMLPRVQMPELNLATRVSLEKIELSHAGNETLSGRVHLTADTINLQRPDIWLPAFGVDTDVKIVGQVVSFNGSVRSDGNKSLFKVAADYDFDTGQGAGRILSDKLSFDTQGKRLSQYFSHWPFEWDIFDGTLNVDVDLQVQDGARGIEIQANIQQSAQNLAGVYSNIGFVGFGNSFAGKFHSPDQLFTTSPVVFNLDSLDVGVPIEQIEGRFSLDSTRQRLVLETIEARLFGGRVWVEDAIYRATKSHNPIFIGVDGLQLDQLLALAGYDAVQATGTISGLLPLDINKAGVTMEQGMLAAKAPGGVFRYYTELEAGTNPAMLQVIEALKNYHYSIFQVEADYLENGDLVLAMLLRGSNPDLQQGRPIHLNLNVTDNIPSLLKSLQSGRVIADTVGKKLGGGVQ